MPYMHILLGSHGTANGFRLFLSCASPSGEWLAVFSCVVGRGRRGCEVRGEGLRAAGCGCQQRVQVHEHIGSTKTNATAGWSRGSAGSLGCSMSGEDKTKTRGKDREEKKEKRNKKRKEKKKRKRKMKKEKKKSRKRKEQKKKETKPRAHQLDYYPLSPLLVLV